MSAVSAVNVEGIPAEMRNTDRWVTWNYAARDAKPTKIPFTVDGSRRASSTASITWGSFEAALATVRAGRADGLGFVLGDGWVGIDLDRILNADGGLAEDFPLPDAFDWVGALGSYTEISPSGVGLHVIGRGVLPEWAGNRKGPVEVYSTGRFFTVSGSVFEGLGSVGELRELPAFLEAAGLRRPQPNGSPRRAVQPVEFDDRELIERARAARNGADFDRLWRGDTSGYASNSEADMALAGMLLFWTGGDPARTDALFRRSGLLRDKWDEGRGATSYGAQTIAEALSTRTEFFDPRQLTATASGRSSSGGLTVVASEGRGASSDSWPAPPGEDAFHGLAGRVVRTIEPHSEADPVALLAQILVVFGNLVGRHAHFRAEADDHYPNLFLCAVGETSKARKGSSYGHVARLASSADATWEERVESGLTSGEGLIWAVRDAEERDDGTDGGARDKRLLVFEPELASVLRVLERQGNRLSPVLRDAWDGRPLRTLTRTTSARATGAHISIVGHITADELRRYLDRTEIANGLGNRFLWLCVRRSRSLPEGGELHRVNVAPLVEELREAARFAGTIGLVRRDEKARALWHDVYPELSDGVPGLVGALTARAEAQTMRLALTYALLDQSDTIKVEHLRAGLELWDYALRSVRYVFGLSLGDPTADTILDALRRAAPDPLTRTDIRAAVGGRVGAGEIERALALLARHRLAHQAERDGTRGRPAERWHLGGGKPEGTQPA